MTFVTGGARSGKSRFALEAARDGRERVFIATAEPLDDEMRARIAKHRRDRDASFRTVEAPLDLAGALRGVPAGTGVAVIDCLTVWLGNLLHKHGMTGQPYPEVTALLEALAERRVRVVVVSNEVGMGIVPDNELARYFRDAAGELNRRVAELADEAVLMVSGMAVRLKGGPH